MHKTVGIPSPVFVEDPRLRQILIAMSEAITQLEKEVAELREQKPQTLNLTNPGQK